MTQNKSGRKDRAFCSEPRERHYTLGHIAFRQICQSDMHYFFSIMASPEREAFLTQLISQAAKYCPDDSSKFEASAFSVLPSRVLNHPLLLIKMPEVKAYAEAIYVGIVSMIDMTQTLQGQEAEFRYYTLEMGEAGMDDKKMDDKEIGERGAKDSCFFCQWRDDSHLNLAELEEPCSLEDFGALISRHIEQAAN